MKGRKSGFLLACMLGAALLLSACGRDEAGETAAVLTEESQQQTTLETAEGEGKPPEQTGFVTEQVLDSEEGVIHYSYYLPETYDGSRSYPLMMTMPGYDMMWFGEDSSGRNLTWSGFQVWTERDEDMIVVSAQLTDWGETSARQAIALTEYFAETFSVDKSRIYAAGYSAGGETMSRAVSMRPDLYAAYLHGASQWDGTYAPIAAHQVAVYLFMAEDDEYYGAQRARDAYAGLYEAYREAGLSDEAIAQHLQVEIPDKAWFRERGILSNYHGGGNLLFQEERILDWILSVRKPAGQDPKKTAFSAAAASAVREQAAQISRSYKNIL